MAKFRSWNKKYKRFAYFEDGVYYYFVARYTDGIVVRINTNNVEYKEFDWQNAEQASNCKSHNDISIFEGDKISFYNKGVYYLVLVKFDGNNFFFTDEFNTSRDYDLFEMLKHAVSLKIIGHIHKSEEVSNDVCS